MAASPEFYKPASTPSPAFCKTPLLASVPVVPPDDDSCRTPTGSGVSYLREPTTCPPAPRKAPPPPCKKRLFVQEQQGEGGAAAATLISLRLDELHRIFRPHPPSDKRRRSARHQQQR